MNGNGNIAARLVDMATQLAKNTALILPFPQRKTRMSFTFFDQLTDQLACGLKSDGMKANDRVALMVNPGGDFFLFTFALLKLGAIPILIDPGMGLRGMKKCLAMAAPDVFIGNFKANLARVVLRWSTNTIRRAYVIGRVLGNYLSLLSCGRKSLQPVLRTCKPDDQAAILFTSGSTGPAKGAVYTHGMFQEQVRVLHEVFGIEPGEVDLCTFPLFALFAPTLGMTSVVPVMDPTRPAKADPVKLIKAIFDHGVTNIFGSPALINVLSRYGEKNDIKLPSIRRVISAGAPVPVSVIERMTKMLPAGVQVFTPYGATEALPVSIIGSDEILHETRFKTEQGAGICVGRPVGQIEIRIIPIGDGPLTSLPPASPVNEIGEITVRGPVVSKSYWRNSEADALHKIHDGDTVWHRMGDVGYLDEQGRLWFCGRKSQRVILKDQTLFTIPCEAIINTHPSVFRSALVAVHKRPVICIELEKPAQQIDQSQLIAELNQLKQCFAPARCISDFLVYPGSFPVDIRHNAKINREKLAMWAARSLR